MNPPRRTGSFRTLLLLAFGLLAAALLAPAAANAATKVGELYTQSNDPTDNMLLAFDRFTDGTIAPAGSFSTGGSGEGSWAPGCSPHPFSDTCAITDSQGSVATTVAGGTVFVANAGSNTISSFRVSPTRGPSFVAQIPSGGDFPQSLTIHGNELYVLNEHSNNIVGFKFTSSGRMTKIPGSSQNLVTTASVESPGAVGAEVGFSLTGSTLVVTERATSLIDTFPVKHGVAQPPIANTSAEPTPFGFTFDAFNHLLVTDAGDGSADGFTSVYGLTLSHTLTTLDPGESTGGRAPCWIVVTPDQRFAYVTNTIDKTIAEYSNSPSGRIRLLGTVSIAGAGSGMAQFPTDIAISRDGRYVYTIVPSVFAGNTSFIEGFKVSPLTGKLTFVTATDQNLPIGISGLTAS